MVHHLHNRDRGSCHLVVRGHLQTDDAASDHHQPFRCFAGKEQFTVGDGEPAVQGFPQPLDRRQHTFGSCGNDQVLSDITISVCLHGISGRILSRDHSAAVDGCHPAGFHGGTHATDQRLDHALLAGDHRSMVHPHALCSDSVSSAVQCMVI